MSSNRARGILILAVLLAVFSVIAFVIPFARTAGFWIAYACGILAVILEGYVIYSAFGKPDAKSRFYGFPVARVGTIYLTAQLAVSIAEFALAGLIPVWVIVLINALLLAFALIGLLTAETVRDEVTRQDQQIRTNTENMRKLQSLAAAASEQCRDEKLKPALRKLAEDIRYSDPVSSEKTAEIEAAMAGKMEKLMSCLKDSTSDCEGICEEISSMLSERNRIAITAKK